MGLVRERGEIYCSVIGSNKAFNDEGNKVFTTPDGVALYTQEDIDALNTKVNEQFKAGTDYAARSINNSLQDKAIKHFRSEVRNGSIDKDVALDIYNGLAEALGWNTVDSITPLFTVVVSYNGNTIAEIEDIEADDTDSAEAEVRYNLEVTDVEVTFEVTYGDHTYNETVNTTYEFDDEFEYQAVEQD